MPSTPFKVVELVRFLPTVDPSRARQQWLDNYGPMIASGVGILRCEQNYLVESLPLGEIATGRPPFDGYLCSWWESEQAACCAAQSAERRAAERAARSFIELDATQSGSVDERVLLAGAHSSFKVAWFVHFRSDIGWSRASAYWADVHGPLTTAVEGFTRYTQNHVPPAYEPRLPCDGFSEHWFPRREDYVAIVASPAWQRLVDDGQNFGDPERGDWGAVFEEHVIYGSMEAR